MPSRSPRILNPEASGIDHAGAEPRVELAGEILQNSGALRMRATGGSMLPAIAPGDLLLFRTPLPGDLARDRVLLVHRHGRFVAHRMVGDGDGMVVTRGDALAANDEAVAPADVIGVLVAQQRGEVALHAGGRHWLRRQRLVRWAIRRNAIAARLFRRLPALAALVA